MLTFMSVEKLDFTAQKRIHFSSVLIAWYWYFLVPQGIMKILLAVLILWNFDIQINKWLFQCFYSISRLILTIWYLRCRWKLESTNHFAVLSAPGQPPEFLENTWRVEFCFGIDNGTDWVLCGITSFATNSPSPRPVPCMLISIRCQLELV